MGILNCDLKRQFSQYQSEYERKAVEVLRSGWYVLGEEVKRFEEELAGYLGAKHCVGLASGLDALYLSFRALGVGSQGSADRKRMGAGGADEVIVPANTYIASVMGITMAGAVPVFVEPDAYYNIDPDQIEAKITERTRAVLTVNLYGQACELEKISKLCQKHGLFLVEDSAQSCGAQFHGKFTNHYADISCLSFYPTKNLGCFGDGGAVVTNSDELSRLFRIYRNYGSEKRYYNMVVGVNSRLDELQAGLLRVKLTHLDELNAERERLAMNYIKNIQSKHVILPEVREGATSVWHLFVIRSREREALMAYLGEKGIFTIVHYPIPPHLSEAYAYLGYQKGSFPITERLADEVLTLPLYNGMTGDEQGCVIDAVNGFAP